MTNLPFMMMNWGRFFADPKVDMLPTEAQGIYALLLGRMWLNQGWLSADDKVLARTLRLDVRRWKSVYKPLIEPLLRREIDRDVGAIYTQKHLQEVRATSLSMLEKNFERTAKARAVNAAKRGRRPTVTERALATVAKPVTETVTRAVTPVATPSKEQPQQKEQNSALQAESSVLSATSPVTALPPRDLAPMPQPAEPPPDDGLRRRLVADGIKPKRGLLGSLNRSG
jgi:uncharacterized protein YdaU (DUF1376 family)